MFSPERRRNRFRGRQVMPNRLKPDSGTIWHPDLLTRWTPSSSVIGECRNSAHRSALRVRSSPPGQRS
jgi:hypothetical protein